MPIRVFHSRPKSVLRLAGEDALNFLQGQVTQNVKSLADGGKTYGLWLNHKGKLLGDSTILRFSEREFLLVSEAMPASALRERLETYLVADEVEITDETHAWSTWTIWGAAALEVPETRLVSWGSGFAYGVRRSTEPCVELLLPEGAPPPCPEATVLSEDEVSALRLAAGIPLVGVDLTEKDLPQEAGLEEHAISFTKGCYLGQEVMARLHAMGQVRRRLEVVRGTGPVPKPGTSLTCAGKPAGDIRRAAPTPEGWVALAMVSLLARGDGSEPLRVAPAD